MYAQKLRDQVGRSLQQLFVYHHSIAWFTWYAKNEPQGLDRARIAAYEAEIHAVGPRLMSEIAAIASLDFSIWEGCVDAVQELMDIEEQVSMHNSRLASTNRGDAVESLALMNTQLRAVMKSAVSRITDLMHDTERIVLHSEPPTRSNT